MKGGKFGNWQDVGELGAELGAYGLRHSCLHEPFPPLKKYTRNLLCDPWFGLV